MISDMSFDQERPISAVVQEVSSIAASAPL